MKASSLRALRRTITCATLALTALTAFAVQGGQYQVLHRFGDLPGDIWQADYAPVMGPDGALYGSAFYGQDRPLTAGAIWRIAPNGSYSVLHNFRTDQGESGYPSGPLMVGADGRVYGTEGGDIDLQWPYYRCGALFALDAAGHKTVLHAFTPDEVCHPVGGLTQGPDGALYGAALGPGLGGPPRPSMIFRLDPDGSLHILHAFTATALEGSDPYGGVALGPDGSLYGTTAFGGEHDDGTLFRLHPDGQLQVLHHFNGSNEGKVDTIQGARVLLASDGHLYGALGSVGNAGAGPSTGAGGVFRASLQGDFRMIARFAQHSTTGPAWPTAGLVEDGRGGFYGTSRFGGAGEHGTVYRITAQGDLTLLHEFPKPTGGRVPQAGVSFGPDGTLYGATVIGGDGGGLLSKGVVFRLRLLPGQ